MTDELLLGLGGVEQFGHGLVLCRLR